MPQGRARVRREACPGQVRTPLTSAWDSRRDSLLGVGGGPRNENPWSCPVTATLLVDTPRGVRPMTEVLPDAFGAQDLTTTRDLP